MWVHVLLLIARHWSNDWTNGNQRREYKKKKQHKKKKRNVCLSWLFNNKRNEEMSENSSPLDLNTLWVECKNADGRVSVLLWTVHLHRRSFSIRFRPISTMRRHAKPLGLDQKDNVSCLRVNSISYIQSNRRRPPIMSHHQLAQRIISNQKWQRIRAH